METINNPQGESVPRPDPTRLTTEQLNKEISSLKELMYLRMDLTDQKVSTNAIAVEALPKEMATMVDHLRGYIETRLVGMDKATQLLQAAGDRMPSHVDEKIAGLYRIMDERFNSVNTRFNDRVLATDKANVLAAQDSKEALHNALLAAKDAVVAQNTASQLAIDKSEKATHEQINQLQATIASIEKGLDDKIDGLIGRIDRNEGSDTGKHTNATSIFSIVAMIISILTFLLFAGTLVWKH